MNSEVNSFSSVTVCVGVEHDAYQWLSQAALFTALSDSSPQGGELEKQLPR